MTGGRLYRLRARLSTLKARILDAVMEELKPIFGNPAKLERPSSELTPVGFAAFAHAKCALFD